MHSLYITLLPPMLLFLSLSEHINVNALTYSLKINLKIFYALLQSQLETI